MDTKEFYNAYVLTPASSRARVELVENFIIEQAEKGEIDAWILTIDFREEYDAWWRAFKGLSSPTAFKKLIEDTREKADPEITIEIISPSMLIFKDTKGFTYRYFLKKIGTGEQNK